MNLQRMLIAAFLVAGATLAYGVPRITPVDEFMGDMWEGFENVDTPGAHPGPITILGGHGTVHDTLTQMIVFTYAWSGPAGDVLPYNGNLFEGTIAGPLVYTFDVPVTQFGGYFTTPGTIPDGTVTFRDAAGEIIDTVSMTLTPVQWAWQGWASVVPIHSVEILSNNIPTCSTLCDDIMITTVPEPSALALLAAGVCLVVRRR